MPERFPSERDWPPCEEELFGLREHFVRLSEKQNNSHLKEVEPTRPLDHERQVVTGPRQLGVVHLFDDFILVVGLGRNK